MSLPAGPDLSLGEWIHEAIAENVTIDDEGWAVELVERVGGRVQLGEPEAARLVPVVTWLQQGLAFTVPGRYVYFTREFLQLAMPEDAVALAYAHEIGHHRLGHIVRFDRGLEWLRRVPATQLVTLLLHGIKRLLESPEQEAAADHWALERCLAAGYDGERCLELFGALERYALDNGDVSGVFGEDVEAWVAEQELREGRGLPPSDRLGAWSAKAKSWLVQRMRGYTSLRERRDTLRRSFELTPRRLRISIG